MADQKLRDLNILSFEPLPAPQEVREEFPLSDAARLTASNARDRLRAILDGSDHRKFFVVGPCSIHDLEAAKEYARKLKGLADELSDAIYLVMRVYFEKPRTSVGWKGFINDPFLDDSFRIDQGIRKARELLLYVNELGLPVGTEALDPITPQYIDDLIAWYAIGARTVESQTHREMSSGLSAPVGFKNGTDGNVLVAVNAMEASSTPHHFLGINQEGRCSIFRTAGNSYSHVILRGGKRPNYDRESIRECEESLRKHSLAENIMVDCSHGNSKKLPERQAEVLADCLNQIEQGNSSIRGFMLESHLHGGNQKLGDSIDDLRYGVSITDACIDWDATESLLRQAADSLR
jgi:3-deoxy-7-phosphoheptulonate synthase